MTSIWLARRQARPLSARAPAVLVVLFAALLAFHFTMPSAWAEDAGPDGTGGQGEGNITWSVAPANQGGPDGRHWVELELSPGEKVEEHFAVTNFSKTPVTFSLAAADGYFTPAGRFNMLADPAGSVAAGLWIDVAEAVEVAPGETVIVPFTVAVPADAEPGDHAAGITAAVGAAAQAEDGTGLGVTSRFGFRVMTRVKGVLEPGLKVVGAGVRYEIAWHPLRPGRVRVAFDLVNTGNSRLTVTGAVSIGGRQVTYPAKDAPVAELLPGDSRRIEVVVDRVWPLFRAHAVITAEPVVLALEGADPPAVQPVRARIGFWTVPWPQLACVAGVSLLVAALFAGRGRSQRRVARLVETTRAEARAAALAELRDGSRGAAGEMLVADEAASGNGAGGARKADGGGSRGAVGEMLVADEAASGNGAGGAPEVAGGSPGMAGGQT